MVDCQHIEARLKSELIPSRCMTSGDLYLQQCLEDIWADYCTLIAKVGPAPAATASPSRSAPVPPTPNHSLEPDLGVPTPTAGKAALPQQDCDNHRTKRMPCQSSSAGFGHHNVNHIPYQRDTVQHTLRKGMAGIHTTTSPYSKNIGLTQLHRNAPHIKQPFETTVDNLFP